MEQEATTPTPVKPLIGGLTTPTGGVRTTPYTDEEYYEHRPYWVFRAKLAVITDRWAEAMQNAVAAAKCPVDEASHDHAEWKVLTRAVEGRLRQVRERIHRTAGLLREERSDATRAGFSEQANRHLEKLKQELWNVCDHAMEVLTQIHTKQPEGLQAVEHLKGDVARYRGKTEDANKHYGRAVKGVEGCAFGNSYHGSCGHLGMHALGHEVTVQCPPGTFGPTQVPFVAMKLSKAIKHQKQSKVHVPFEQADLVPAPLPAL